MPNRILKESICTSDNIDQLSAFEETFFYRLIVNCDDYGRMDARPKILASKLFPLKGIRISQIESALRALTSAELVILYTVDGKPFLQMKTWDKHQQIRSQKSKYPSPESSDRPSDISCNQLISSDIRCNQLISDDIRCSRNPIQSESESESESLSAHAREEREILDLIPWNMTSENLKELHELAGKLTDARTVVQYAVEEARKYGGRSAAYMIRVLRSLIEDGVKGAGDIERRKQHAAVPAQQYTQREYRDENALPDWVIQKGLELGILEGGAPNDGRNESA